jgi:ferredoxin
MPENYTPIYKVPSKDEQTRLLKETDERIDRIPSLLELNGHSEKTSLFAPIASALAHPIYKYGRSTRKFKVTEECTGCGICEAACQINAIAMVEGRPRWVVQKCIRCAACIHRCPVEAIRLGRSHKNGQYLNPNVEHE